MAIYSSELATSVANMVTERHISGGTTIKETKTRITENPASKDHVTTVGKWPQGS